MFIHSVYFWLKENLSDAERADFLRGVQSLLGVDTIVRGHIGTPAATRRVVIDSSYDYALVFEFTDQAEQDVYQEHPIHLQFVADCAKYWARVQVYDSVA